MNISKMDIMEIEKALQDTSTLVELLYEFGLMNEELLERIKQTDMSLCKRKNELEVIEKEKWERQKLECHEILSEYLDEPLDKHLQRSLLFKLRNIFQVGFGKPNKYSYLANSSLSVIIDTVGGYLREYEIENNSNWANLKITKIEKGNGDSDER